MRSDSAAASAPRRIVALVFPDVVLLDLAGPCEVFFMANRIARRLRPDRGDPYAIEVVSVDGNRRCRSANGLVLAADRTLTKCKGRMDTLLVPGGMCIEGLLKDKAFIAWLRKAGPRARRIGSICTGAYFLAAAGLLDGRSATTHWQDCEPLARAFPKITVQPDRIFVQDGNVYTSAGVTAGMDLALALVQEDLGRQVALKVAQTLVMFVRRPGGQSQFSTLLESQGIEGPPLNELMIWSVEHPAEDLSVEAMAGRVNMSVRNFSRTFRRETGKTPA